MLLKTLFFCLLLALSANAGVIVRVGGTGGSAAATYTVTYNGNGNTGGTAPVDASSPYAAGATVTTKTKGDLVKTDFTFSKWNTAADGSGTDRAEASTWAMPAANVTLYAIWFGEATYYPNSTDCSAYYGQVADGTNDADPPSALLDYNTAITGADLTNISTDDSNFHHATATGKMGHRITIKITQSTASISNIEITTKGWGSRFIFTPGQWLHVWDNANTHWDASIGNNTSAAAPGSTITANITTGFAGFIDGSGYFNYLTHSPKAIGSNSWDDIYFTKIVVYYTP